MVPVVKRTKSHVAHRKSVPIPGSLANEPNKNDSRESSYFHVLSPFKGILAILPNDVVQPPIQTEYRLKDVYFEIFLTILQ